MEKIQNILENNVGSSRRFENVKEELLDYQFQYVEKIEKGEINEIKENEKDESEYGKKQKEFEDSLRTDFEKKLFKYTDLYSSLFDEYHKRIEDKDEDESLFGNWLKSILYKINYDYSLGDQKWKDNVLNIIKENLAKIGPIKEEKEESKKMIKVGLVDFNLEQVKKMQDFGINSNDLCLNLHLERLSKQKENNNEINNIFSSESLSKLSVKIIEDYPQVKAIIGRSWLIDSPIGRRIGFNVYKKNEKVIGGSGFWGQFINEKGRINKERIQRFLNTGRPDFYPSEGFIKVEDFLKKYLPEHRRGKIILKERTKASLKLIEDIDVITKKINKEFDTLSIENIIQLMNSNIIFANYLKNQDGQKLLNMLVKAKESKIKSMNDFIYDGKSDILIKLREYIKEKSETFVEKEIFIPLEPSH